MKPFKLGVKSWKKGVINKRLDERLYDVICDGNMVRRNRVHLKKTNEPYDESTFMSGNNSYGPIKVATNLDGKLDARVPTPVEITKSEYPKHRRIESIAKRLDVDRQETGHQQSPEKFSNGSHHPGRPPNGKYVKPSGQGVTTRSGRTVAAPKYLSDYVSK